MPFSPDSDITKISDKELANLHLGGWKDRFSIQANVEMSRRLKNEIKKLRETSSKYSRALIWLTVLLAFLAGAQICLFFLAWKKQTEALKFNQTSVYFLQPVSEKNPKFGIIDKEKGISIE
ncbi:hypothetical protein J7K86_00215, partial [bacterium]|nr:hypothetical protein [bacterium]